MFNGEIMNIKELNACEINELLSNAIQEIKRRYNFKVIYPISPKIIKLLMPYIIQEKYVDSATENDVFLIEKNLRNVSAVNANGERYKFSHVYGAKKHTVSVLLKPYIESERLAIDSPLFEYFTVAKFDDNGKLTGIYQFDWDCFISNSQRKNNFWKMDLSQEILSKSHIVYLLDK